MLALSMVFLSLLCSLTHGLKQLQYQGIFLTCLSNLHGIHF